MLTKRSGNKVLLIELNSLATKFCLQNGLATKFFLQNGGGVMHPLFILYAPPVYITKWGAYPQVSTTCIWHRQYGFHRSSSGNQVLLQKGLAHKFCLQNSLATKFYLRNRLAPKLCFEKKSGNHFSHLISASISLQNV